MTVTQTPPIAIEIDRSSRGKVFICATRSLTGLVHVGGSSEIEAEERFWAAANFHVAYVYGAGYRYRKTPSGDYRLHQFH